MDVTDEQSVANGVQFVRARTRADDGSDGGLWALVNNAGVPGAAGLDDWLRVEDYQKVMSVNLCTLWSSQTVVP